MVTCNFYLLSLSPSTTLGFVPPQEMRKVSGTLFGFADNRHVVPLSWCHKLCQEIMHLASKIRSCLDMVLR